MDTKFLSALDEYFCANYSDYVRLNALEGYKKPDVIYIAKDGNIARRDASCMRLCHQENAAALLAAFKRGYTDVEYTFNFRFIPARQRLGNRFRKNSFSKVLRRTLAKYKETPETAGAQLALGADIWGKIAKGKLYPEKCTVMALALVCRMRMNDVQNLMNAGGFALTRESVRDVVFSYLVEQGVFNAAMRDMCLAEYHINTLPIAPPAPEEAPNA